MPLEAHSQIIASGVSRRFIHLMRHADYQLSERAKHFLMNMCRSNICVDELLELGLINQLLPLLQAGDPVIREHPIMCLVNIAAGGPLYIQAIMDASVFQIVRAILLADLAHEEPVETERW